MKIAALMTSNPISVDVTASVDSAMRLMDDHGVRHLPVTEGGRFVGLISDRELLQATGWLPRRLREARQGAFEISKERSVREQMHSPAMHVKPEDDVLTLAVEAVVQGVGCVPVVDMGRLVGIVTERDMLAAFLHRKRGQTSLLVREVMSQPARILQRTASLGEAQDLCLRWEVRHVPILDGERLVGILSDRDIRRARGRGRRDDYPIEELMTTQPVTIGEKAAIDEAAALLTAHRCSALPVLRGDEIVGIVAVEDLIGPCLRELT